jgi:hypothetical protein
MIGTPLQISRHNCEDSIKTGLKEIGREHVDWFDVA